MEMLARSRLHALLALWLVLLLATATGSLLGSAQHLLGATSVATSASASDDDSGDGLVAIVPQPLVVVALLFALALGVVFRPSPNGAVGETRRARDPPSH
jgi:hypothetical protein